jgi:glutamate synthase domain-containing protein 1
MCGIVGLFLKNPALEPRLGGLVATMLETMTDRGPDSAGFAVYGAGAPERVKLTLRVEGGPGATETLLGEFETALGTPIESVAHDSHVVASVPAKEVERARAWLVAARPDVRVVGAGRRMELYKGVGMPAAVSRRFDLAQMSGTHAIGHTRMATESAVTTDGAHPYSTGMDQCLVHNGSLSNHNAVRRVLRRQGLAFETENDTEVAAGYLTWRMREGATLKEALEAGLEDLDGFYTFVVGTESGFAVLRDPIACKPAVMAETEDYVAFGSEYRVLVGLPGIEAARVFEPEPATVYVWERA